MQSFQLLTKVSKRKAAACPPRFHCASCHGSEDAVPGFTLRVELWSCAAAEDELTPVNTPRKLAKKLRNSLGRKWRPLPDTPDPDAFLQSNPLPAYVYCIAFPHGDA